MKFRIFFNLTYQIRNNLKYTTNVKKRNTKVVIFLLNLGNLVYTLIKQLNTTWQPDTHSKHYNNAKHTIMWFVFFLIALNKRQQFQETWSTTIPTRHCTSTFSLKYSYSKRPTRAVLC